MRVLGFQGLRVKGFKGLNVWVVGFRVFRVLKLEGLRVG
jgi:hypothetical protein